VTGKFACVTGERDENLLGHIAGAVRITICATQRGAINEIDVPLDELRESGLRILFGVLAKECRVIVHVICLLNSAAR
jgi:hypothetical protein